MAIKENAEAGGSRVNKGGVYKILIQNISSQFAHRTRSVI